MDKKIDFLKMNTLLNQKFEELTGVLNEALLSKLEYMFNDDVVGKADFLQEHFPMLSGQQVYDFLSGKDSFICREMSLGELAKVLVLTEQSMCIMPYQWDIYEDTVFDKWQKMIDEQTLKQQEFVEDLTDDELKMIYALPTSEKLLKLNELVKCHMRWRGLIDDEDMDMDNEGSAVELEISDDNCCCDCEREQCNCEDKCCEDKKNCSECHDDSKDKKENKNKYYSYHMESSSVRDKDGVEKSKYKASFNDNGKVTEVKSENFDDFFDSLNEIVKERPFGIFRRLLD